MDTENAADLPIQDPHWKRFRGEYDANLWRQQRGWPLDLFVKVVCVDGISEQRPKGWRADSFFRTYQLICKHRERLENILRSGLEAGHLCIWNGHSPELHRKYRIVKCKADGTEEVIAHNTLSPVIDFRQGCEIAAQHGYRIPRNIRTLVPEIDKAQSADLEYDLCPFDDVFLPKSFNVKKMISVDFWPVDYCYHAAVMGHLHCEYEAPEEEKKEIPSALWTRLFEAIESGRLYAVRMPQPELKAKLHVLCNLEHLSKDQLKRAETFTEFVRANNFINWLREEGLPVHPVIVPGEQAESATASKGGGRKIGRPKVDKGDRICFELWENRQLGYRSMAHFYEANRHDIPKAIKSLQDFKRAHDRERGRRKRKA